MNFISFGIHLHENAKKKTRKKRRQKKKTKTHKTKTHIFKNEDANSWRNDVKLSSGEYCKSLQSIKLWEGLAFFIPIILTTTQSYMSKQWKLQAFKIRKKKNRNVNFAKWVLIWYLLRAEIRRNRTRSLVCCIEKLDLYWNLKLSLSYCLGTMLCIQRVKFLILQNIFDFFQNLGVSLSFSIKVAVLTFFFQPIEDQRENSFW